MKCPRCQSENIIRNGSIHNGKQKYECKECRRQFVENPQNKIISSEIKVCNSRLSVNIMQLSSSVFFSSKSHPTIRLL